MMWTRRLMGTVAAMALVGGIADRVAALPILTIELLATPTSSTENTGVSGRLTLGFNQESELDFLSLTIENTTLPSIGSKLTAVGLEVPPALPNAPVFAPGGAGAYFQKLDYDFSVPPGWLNAPGGYDLMVSSDHNFLGGSPNGAPGPGDARTVVLALGNTGYAPAALRDVFLDHYESLGGPVAIGRFQAVGPDGEGSDRVIATQVVPEPATLLLLLVGSGVLALPGRRGTRRPSRERDA